LKMPWEARRPELAGCLTPHVVRMNPDVLTEQHFDSRPRARWVQSLSTGAGFVFR
jgi:hypothetical protein